MNIPANQISYKKQIGKLDGDPIIEMATKGGLHLIIASRKGKAETLGTGSHRAIARHIAEKKEPKIEWTELAKSDQLELSYFQHLLPKWEEITEDFRKQGE